jgi:hypothetical protein
MPLSESGLLEIPPQRVMSDIIDAPSHGLDLTHGSNRHKAGGVLTYSATRSPVFPTSWRRGRKRPGRGLQKKENGFTRPATQQTWPRSQIPCLRQRLPGACGHPARFGFTAAACVLHWMQTILGYQHRPKSRHRKNLRRGRSRNLRRIGRSASCAAAGGLGRSIPKASACLVPRPSSTIRKHSAADVGWRSSPQWWSRPRVSWSDSGRP